MRIEGAIIAITGAAQGFGRAFARDLAARGACLALIDIQGEKLEQVHDEVTATGGEARSWTVDISNERQTVILFEQLAEAFGGLDVLINNAGVTRDGPLIGFGPDGKLTRLPFAAWRKVIDVNLTGTFLCGREAAALMTEQEHGGLIVNLTSITRVGNPGQSNYAAAKAGVASLTVTWAHELAAQGIRVVAIAPGYIDTEMTASVAEAQLDRLIGHIPSGRLGAVEEITATLRFVLENDYVNGRVLEVDGGLRL